MTYICYFVDLSVIGTSSHFWILVIVKQSCALLVRIILLPMVWLIFHFCVKKLNGKVVKWEHPITIPSVGKNPHPLSAWWTSIYKISVSSSWDAPESNILNILWLKPFIGTDLNSYLKILSLLSAMLFQNVIFSNGSLQQLPGQCLSFYCLPSWPTLIGANHFSNTYKRNPRLMSMDVAQMWNCSPLTTKRILLMLCIETT